MIETLLFCLAAAVLLASAVAVIVSKNPLRGALYLVCALCSVALLFVLLDASFLAAMQVLVYAGAIMVLFIFVIMLLNLGDSSRRPNYLSIAKILGSAAMAFLAWRMGSGVLSGPQSVGVALDGGVRNIGKILLTDYLFAFESISIVLLVAVVGAVVLGLKRLT